MRESFDLSCFYFGHSICSSMDIHDLLLFELNGVIHFDLCSEGKVSKKCRIRVSPYRFLEVDIIPEMFSVSFFAVTPKNEVQSGFNHPVELVVKKDGTYFDAWSFLLSQKIRVEPCEIEFWKDFKKECAYLSAVVVNSSCCGLCKFDYQKEDDDYYSAAYYLPGKLAICGHPIDAITWVSKDEHGSLMDKLVSCRMVKPFVSVMNLDKNAWDSFVEEVNESDCEFDYIRIFSSGIKFFAHQCSANVRRKYKVEIAGMRYHKEYFVSEFTDVLENFVLTMNAIKDDDENGLSNYITKAKMLGKIQF